MLSDDEFLHAFFTAELTKLGLSSPRPSAAGLGLYQAISSMLLDPALPFKHWRREAMFTPEARAEWREPDLAPLPF